MQNYNGNIIFNLVLKRPELLKKIKEAHANANERRTLLDSDNVLNREQLHKEEGYIKNDIKKYVIKYMKSIKVLLADEYDERIRKIINKRDKDGNAPLHYAVSNWPQKVVKDMLKLGADLSIENNSNQIPLTMLPKTTLSEFFDEHCMVSDGFDALDDDDYYYQSNIDEEEHSDDDDRFYKELLDDYDPKFMTNIVQLPITFKYDLLSPTPYSKRTHPSKDSIHEVSYSTPSEMSVLAAVCKSKKHCDLVTHPVIKSFIWLKWKLVSKCYNRNLRMNILLTYCLTWYIFHQFGGLEANHKCLQLVTFSNEDNFTQFCEKSWEEYENLTKNYQYGDLESKSLIKRWEYYLDHIYSDEGKCMYIEPFYLFFVLMSLVLGFLMVLDTVKDFFPRRYVKDGHPIKSFTCMSCILPIGMDTINLVLLLMVLFFSVRVLWIVISVIFLITMFSEVTQLVMAPKKYFRKLSNWADVGIIILITLILYVPNDSMLDPITFSLHSTVEKVCSNQDNSSCQNHPTDTVGNHSMNDQHDVSVKRFLSSFLIVLSWTRFVFDIAKHPGKRTESFNKYAMMYGKVASSFFKLLFCYCLFIVAFSFGFYISFHNDIGDARMNVDSLTPYVFFESQFEAFIKVMAMFVGEVDFNNMPVGVSYARQHGNVSVFLGYVFFLVFVFMITMVLMNLLNGLAVTDITEIVRESEVLHQISLIDILSDFEEMAFTYKKGLEFVSNTCSCLKMFLLTHMDISKELLLFSTQNSSDIRREKMFKRQKTLPFSYDPISNSKANGLGKLRHIILNHFRVDENKGSDHILTEARNILIRAKKSRMDQRAFKKKQKKEMEEAVQRTEIERQKTVDLLKQTVMDRLIPIVETKTSAVHF